MDELRGKDGLETASIAVLNARLNATLKVIEMVPGYLFFRFFVLCFFLLVYDRFLPLTGNLIAVNGLDWNDLSVG